MGLRTPLMVLNELSLPDTQRPIDDAELTTSLTTFIETLRAARCLRFDLALVSHVSLLRHPVSKDGRTVSAFMQSTGRRLREELRLLQQLRNHAPFTAAPKLRLRDAGEEYRYGGQPADGFGLAVANHLLAVSMQAEAWPDSDVAIEHGFLEEHASGEAAEQTVTVPARHASVRGHVECHARFVRELGLVDPVSGADLWPLSTSEFYCANREATMLARGQET